MDDIVIKSWLAKQDLFSSTFLGTRIAKMGGSYGMIKSIHLNRTGNKRKTQYEDAPKMGRVTAQPLDCNSFNFTKANAHELIDDDILINVSPLAFGHFLFCPSLNDKRPQILQKSSIADALTLAGNFSRPDFKLFFNSLGGWASVNHMHFHGVFLAGCSTVSRTWHGHERVVGLDCCLFDDGRFPIEHASVSRFLSSRNGSDVCCLNYIVPGIRISNTDRDRLLSDCWEVIDHLLRKDIPHNILVTNQGRCIYIVPRQVQKVIMLPFSEPGGGIHVASSEIFGAVICFDESTYKGLDESSYIDVLRRQVAVDPTVIQNLLDLLN